MVLELVIEEHLRTDEAPRLTGPFFSAGAALYRVAAPSTGVSGASGQPGSPAGDLRAPRSPLGPPRSGSWGGDSVRGRYGNV